MENKVSREDLTKALNNINEPLNLDIMKGRAAMVGEIRTWGGKKFKKQGNGKWVEISEKGMTKKEHYDKVQYSSERLDAMRVGYNSKEGKIHQKNLKDNHEQYKKLSDKEYDDKDFEEKEERQTYKKGDKIEFNGVTIHVGKDTSGGQDTLTYKSPDISDKTFYDLSKLKEKILEKTPQSDIGFKKSLQDHFSIINAPLSFNKREEIKKSDVYYALDDNYNSQSSIGKFKKKGSELKAMASTKKAKYETKKVIIEANKEEAMSKLKEAGVECIEGEYGCKLNYNYETTPQSTRDLIHKYNNLSYECEGINKDIKALNVIIKHCEDNKMYDVTARQLISLDDE